MTVRFDVKGTTDTARVSTFIELLAPFHCCPKGNSYVDMNRDDSSGKA